MLHHLHWIPEKKQVRARVGSHLILVERRLKYWFHIFMLSCTPTAPVVGIYCPRYKNVSVSVVPQNAALISNLTIIEQYLNQNAIETRI